MRAASASSPGPDPTARALTSGELDGVRSLDIVLAWRYGEDWTPRGNGLLPREEEEEASDGRA